MSDLERFRGYELTRKFEAALDAGLQEHGAVLLVLRLLPAPGPSQYVVCWHATVGDSDTSPHYTILRVEDRVVDGDAFSKQTRERLLHTALVAVKADRQRRAERDAAGGPRIR